MLFIKFIKFYLMHLKIITYLSIRLLKTGEGDRSQYRIEYYGIYYFNQINVENSFGKDYDTLLGESEVLAF